MKDKSFLIFNNFILKILIIVLTTLGCIGQAMLIDASLNNTLTILASVFTVIGNVSFPIISFLLIQGIIFTTDKKRYLLRLLVVEVICLIIGSVGEFAFKIHNTCTFITDIILALLFIYLIQSKNEKLYLVAILPILYEGLSYFATGYETLNSLQGLTILWFPSFLRCRAPIYSLLIIVFGYYSIKILKRFSFNSIDVKNMDNRTVLSNPEYRFGFNLSFTLVYILVTGLFYLISSVTNSVFDIFNASYQMYTILGCLPIIFYNGLKGYDRKWFRYFNYLFFPIILSIAFGIVLIITL